MDGVGNTSPTCNLVPMKSLVLTLVVLFTLAGIPAQSQESDVFVVVKGDRLHFHVIKGRGIPILFEAGGGDNSTVWTEIVKPIHQITGATLITYDRAGFGQSELNPDESAVERHGIENGIEELEEALRQLGYDHKIMLVAHSYGALYATLYAARHPNLVKTAVFIDGSSACWFDEEWMRGFVRGRKDEGKPAVGHLGNYYQSANLPKTVELMRKTSFPSSVPVIDLVSEHPPFSDAKDSARWTDCHRTFANAQPNRQSITVYRSGHYIYRDNPQIVIDAIVKAYNSTASQKTASEIMNRYLDYEIERANTIGGQHGVPQR